MKGELIVGLLCLAIGIFLLFLTLPKGSTEKSKKRNVIVNAIGFLPTLWGWQSLAQWFLSLPGDAITVKNGTFLFLSVCALSYVTFKIVAVIKSKMK